MKPLVRSRSYEQELRLLPQTYEAAMRSDLGPLRAVIQQLGGRPAYFIGSGGALAVARLAATSYERAFRIPSRACTPLEFLALAPTTTAGAVLFSASGKNKDSIATLKHAQSGSFDPACVVTMRQEPIPLPTGRGIRQVVLDAPPLKDGFLATNSVLYMATVWLRAMGYSSGLAPTLPTAGNLERPLRDHCLILSAPGVEAVAIDLETRLAEVGLATAQIADYRNFAHGRHFGFSNNIASTTVVALWAPPFDRIADRTLGLLPTDAHVVKLDTKFDWPMSSVALLHKTMTLVLASANARAIRVARPGVPSFGRELYNLNYVKLLPSTENGAVDKKLAASGFPQHDAHTRKLLEDQLDAWLNQIHDQEFDSLVLDYDGTVCSTDARDKPPGEAVQAALVQLLTSKVELAFATGRGDSLWTGLRSWIPPHLWSRVTLGLYNSSLVMQLSDEVESSPRNDDIARISELLRADPLISGCTPHESQYQIRLERGDGALISIPQLRSHVSSLLAARGETRWRALASAHSVDVIPKASSKTGTVDALKRRGFRRPLLIGDQGHPGGNDFELLASSPYSLSVDRCSADVASCWNLGVAGEAGPQLLTKYLSALKVRDGSFRFRWSSRGRR